MFYTDAGVNERIYIEDKLKHFFNIAYNFHSAHPSYLFEMLDMLEMLDTTISDFNMHKYISEVFHTEVNIEAK